MDRAFPSKAHERRQSAPPPALSPSRIGGRYRIESELGRGGMGAVFRAYDEGAERVVALKLLEHGAGKLGALFEREYETLARLSHPRVIQVYDFGLTESGGRYYTMELLGGADLVALAPLPWVRVCEHLRDVCSSLSLLHAQRLVHRDVNPRNVRLDDTGRAKLLDFGALAPFGVSTELVGTPSCMAPEVLRGEALDARTDLFSLGAVAYWSLTGRLPYAIRRLSEAEEGWSVQPAPPSQHIPSIPKALDDLVLALLSLNPLGRPTSAAEVIDRLSAIALLDDALLSGIAESHLASVALAGREPELSKLEQLLARTLRGRGGTLVFEGDPGGGRSRMLAELHVDAQLAGLSTLHIAGSACTEERWLPVALLRALRVAAPQETRSSLARYPALLGLEAVHNDDDARRGHPAEDASREPHEQAMRLASALVGLIREVSAKRPLLITIDDAHVLNPLDAGVLPLLAHAAQDGRLMLCVTRLAEGSAPPAIDQLRYTGTRLVLTHLPLAAVEQLVHSIFGEVPHRARLAQWLSNTSHGNPGQLLVLLRDLVARGAVRYAQGAWVLPAELGALLPQATRELDAGGLARIDTVARRLAQLLAVQPGDLGEALCVHLMSDTEPRHVLEALRQLCEEKLVSTGPHGYRLARDSLRKLILTELSADAQQKLHRAWAEALRASHRDKLAALQASAVDELTTSEVLLGINAGLHFLRAGDVELGTLLLRIGAVELTIRGEGLTAAVPDLELAIETFRQREAPPVTYAALMTTLALAGTYADFRLSYRYGDELLGRLADVSGLPAARRLQRYLGGKLALFVCLAYAFAAFWLSPSRRVTNSFKEVLLGLMGIGSAVLGVCSVLQDRERASRVAELLSPLRFFSREHPVRMVYEFQLSMVDHAYGHYESARDKARAALAYVQSAAAARRLPEDARLQLEAGIYILLGQIDALRTDGSAEETLRAIEKLSTSTSRQTHAATRVSIHGHRGEREEFVRALDEMDRLAAKAGSIWRNDVQVPRMLWSTYAMCEDVMSLKRAVQQLDTLADEVPSVALVRDATHASYLAERGMAAEALLRHESVFRNIEADFSVRSMQYMGAYARILRKAGHPQRAREVCEAALARLSPEQLAFTMWTFGIRLELPLALGQLGEHARARALLDELVAEQSQHDNPLLHGLTHGAYAELLLMQQNLPEAQRQLAAMGGWFRSTEHPALFAQYQRLCDRARMPRTGEFDVSRERPSLDAAQAVASGIQAQSLEALLASATGEAQAEQGYVFAREGTALVLRARTGSAQLPSQVVEELTMLLTRAGKMDFQTQLAAPAASGSEMSTVVDDTGGELVQAAWRAKPAYAYPLLAPTSDSTTTPIGLLLLLEGEQALRRVSTLRLAQLARSIVR